MADSVGDVAKQEFFPPRHSHVADHEDVDRLPLGGANDRHRRIVIDDEQRTTALPGELPGIAGEFLAGGDRSGVFGGSVHGGGRALRYDYLHDDQLSTAALGKRGGPYSATLWFVAGQGLFNISLIPCALVDYLSAVGRR
jgi:hypothetical protein